MRTSLFVLLLLCCTGAAAQTIAITGAKVHTVGPQGTIEDATIIIVDGKFSAIGQGLSAPGKRKTSQKPYRGASRDRSEAGRSTRAAWRCSHSKCTSNPCQNRKQRLSEPRGLGRTELRLRGRTGTDCLVTRRYAPVPPSTLHPPTRITAILS